VKQTKHYIRILPGNPPERGTWIAVANWVDLTIATKKRKRENSPCTLSNPGPSKVSVKPREMLTGDIDLRYVIRDLNAMKKSDVLLFWAYKSPDELHIRRWSGGWVLIPQQK
jgi:hypothetical protein